MYEEKWLATDLSSTDHWNPPLLEPDQLQALTEYKELLACEITLSRYAYKPCNNKSITTADRTTNLPAFAVAVSDTQLVGITRIFQQLLSYSTEFYPHSPSWYDLYQQTDYILPKW